MPRRGSTTQRGYGTEHQRIRAKWAPMVAAGQVPCHAKVCLMPTRRIMPGQKWDLGHNEERTRWTGPEHQKCNRTDGSKRRGRLAQRRWKL